MEVVEEGFDHRLMRILKLRRTELRLLRGVAVEVGDSKLKEMDMEL